MNQQRNGGHAPPAFTFIDTAMPDKSREGGEGALCTSDDYLAYIDEYISDGLKALNRQTDATDVNDATESGSTNDAPVVSTASADHARPSTSPAAIEKVSFTTKDTASLPDCALHYQWYMEQTPITDGTYNVEGVTENWSASYQHLGFIGKIDHARPSTTRARMEEASASFQDGVTNATATGGREHQELCGVCGNVSSARDALQGHAKEHTGDTAHFCKACDQSSVKVSKSVEHYRNRTGKKYKCKTCDKLFHRAHHLAVHYRTHTDERPYKCNICDKLFHRADHLAKHYRTHTDERPYKCTICDKSFRQSDQLNTHKRTHTGERPYKCQICDKSFRQSGHLDNHKHTHTGEKRYICKTCGKSFTRAENLRRHQYTHAE
ncbi:zinc finger protein 625-like isoform X2 [Dermacentor albipictus]|uniref:zinc finger protein 625-like isoform X2 n=1 Tax=Dermacentor albipictus TaxID=60249 RepID=UPI0038FC0410